MKFEFNQLKNLSTEQINELVAQKKKNGEDITSIEIEFEEDASNFEKKNLAQWSKDFCSSLTNVLKKLPENTSAVNFVGYCINELTADQVVEILKSTHKKVTSLGFSAGISYFKADDLKKLLIAIPSQVTSLSLTNNQAFTEKKSFFILSDSISRHVKFLDLSGTRLRHLLPDDFSQGLVKLTKDLTSLNLSDNSLNVYSADQLAKILSSIDKNVLSLNLSKNHLSAFRGDDRIKVINSIPKSVKQIVIDETFRAQQLIEKEILRLTASKKDSKNPLIHLGLTVASDMKITALTHLKEILEKNPSDMIEQLGKWRTDNKKCIETERNKIHALFKPVFQPSHKTTSQKVIEDVFSFLKVPTDNIECKNMSL